MKIVLEGDNGNERVIVATKIDVTPGCVTFTTPDGECDDIDQVNQDCWEYEGKEYDTMEIVPCDDQS